MPRTVLKQSQLTDEAIAVGGANKGKYLAVELLHEHQQEGCTPVPAGTRGIITAKGAVAKNAHERIFLFPHTVLNETKVFKDGDIRVLVESDYKALGRINHE
jgi:hypothetical protein